MHVDSDRTFRLDADRDEVWDALGRVEDYPTWWPWLRGFDAGRLEAGQRWQCAVKPPVPYELRFEVELVDVVARTRVAATVSGDIGGSAELTLEADGSGTTIHLVSSLAPRHGVLTLVTKLAPWMARYGHDWVLDTGARQFESRAL